MAKSKKSQEEKKPEAEPSVETAAVRKRPSRPQARRVAVQYTPRVPTARCPWC